MQLTLAAAALAAITLAALLVTEAFGWWWADPFAALMIAGFLAVEGVRVAIISASDSPPPPFRKPRRAKVSRGASRIAGGFVPEKTPGERPLRQSYRPSSEIRYIGERRGRTRGAN